MTQSDLDGGSVLNTAQGTATDPGGNLVQADNATALSTVLGSPTLRVVKTVDEATYDTAGDVLTYTITVSNTGNVTLSSVQVSDPAPGAGGFVLDCSDLPTTLAPGDSGTCTATYVVTQADLDAGTVVNSATADAENPAGNPVQSPDATTSSSARAAASLALVKTVDAVTYDEVGDTLTYTVTATNSGNVTLSGVTVSDPAPGAGAFALDCSSLAPTLSPGDAGSCTATYAVTQADLDAGTVLNSATADAVDPSGGAVASTEATAVSARAGSQALMLTKTVSEHTYTTPGDVLHYAVTATNTGNTTLTSVVVSDSAPGAGAYELDCGALPSTLQPGSAGSCTATYAVTQADLDNGTVVNTATAAAQDPSGAVVRSGPRARRRQQTSPPRSRCPRPWRSRRTRVPATCCTSPSRRRTPAT